MIVTILGCGGSDGVPQIGCNCSVCMSNNDQNKRTRASILIEKNNFRLLVDCGPDIKNQMIRENIHKIDGVFITHSHYDHIAGLGDLKLLRKNGEKIQLYGDFETVKVVQNTFSYAFKSSKLYPAIVQANSVSGNFSLIEPQMTIKPFFQTHGKYYSYGIRINNFAYSTDVNYLNDAAYDVLNGVKTFIIDCVRYYSSPTHFALDDAMRAILRVRPERAILTHMCHDIDYESLSKILPPNVSLAYDGMRIEI